MSPLATSDLNHGIAGFLSVLEEALFARLRFLLQNLLSLHMRQLFKVHCPSDIIISLSVIDLVAISLRNLKRPLIVPQECQLIFYIRHLLIMFVFIIGVVCPRLHQAAGSCLEMKWLLSPSSGSIEAVVEALVPLHFYFRLPPLPLSLKAVREEIW